MSPTLIVCSLAVTLGAALLAASPAQTQYCEGTVHGLSNSYDPDTGSGFLAVRARPASKSPKVHELFNGDKVEITDRSGNWYFVGGEGFEGWAHRKWMHNSCND